MYQNYIRKTKGNRHICHKCKAKRCEKYMKKTGKITNWAQEEWECVHHDHGGLQ